MAICGAVEAGSTLSRQSSDQYPQEVSVQCTALNSFLCPLTIPVEGEIYLQPQLLLQVHSQELVQRPHESQSIQHLCCCCFGVSDVDVVREELAL